MTAPGSALFASAGGDRVSIVLGLEPVFPAAHAVGPAFTVQGAPGDNLALHHAVASAAPGAVIVLAVGGERQVAHCGGILATAALERGIAGLVLDGAIRDRAEIAELGLPVFFRGTSPRGPAKNGPGALGVPVELDGVTIRPGDLVCADADGVAIVPAADVAAVQADVAALEAREQSIVARDPRRHDDRRPLRAEGASVKITRIDATPLAIPLAQEFHWAGGAQLGANLVLFTVHTDEGVTGYGESICEDQRAVAAYGELLARQFVGHSPGDVEAILRSVWTEGRWKMFPQFTNLLVAGLEVACWDALGRALGVPTRTFFGGSVQEELDYFGFLQGDEPERLAAHARELAGEGYRVIYLKVGRGARDDDACVAAVREAIGPEPLLRIDPNEAWDRATAVDRIRRLEQYDLDWVEQPTPAGDVNGLAHVRRSVSAKIAADQSVFTTSQLLHVLEKEAADVVVQGSHDAGGLLRFRQQAFVCDAHGLQGQPPRVHGERDQLLRERPGRSDDPEPHDRQPDHAPAPGRTADERAAPCDRGRPLPPERRTRPRLRDRRGRGRRRPRAVAARRRLQHDRVDRGGEVSKFDPAGLTVYVDGEYVDGAEASVPIWDHGVLYGDGIFEGMRLFDGALFRPRDHLARLERSARSIGLELPLGEEELLDVICEVIVRSDLSDAHVRPIVTRGVGAPGVDPARCERSALFVAAYPFPPLLGSDPIRVLISSVVRKAPRSVGAHVKSLNYLDAVLAKRQATAAGMQEAIMLDHLGAVAECSAANVFAVFDGVLVTPTTRSALPGITRRTILELAEEQGIPTEERDIWPMELSVADALFATGSGAGIVPIAEVDGVPVRTVGNPVAAALARGLPGPHPRPALPAARARADRAMKGATAIVVGGGILGATTACELARGGLDVLLLEAGRFGEQSTGKSAAIVRCHYSNPEVVRMALRSRETLRRLPLLLECDPVYTRCGWLFLVDEESAAVALENAEMQDEEGLDTFEVLDLQQFLPGSRGGRHRPARSTSRTPASPIPSQPRTPTWRRSRGSKGARSRARRSRASWSRAIGSGACASRESSSSATASSWPRGRGR